MEQLENYFNSSYNFDKPLFYNEIYPENKNITPPVYQEHRRTISPREREIIPMQQQPLNFDYRAFINRINTLYALMIGILIAICITQFVTISKIEMIRNLFPYIYKHDK